jgi:hypothetical protein
MQTIAYHATLFQGYSGVSGIAMRTPDRRVYFRDEATQTWRELFDADASNLHLHGRTDVVLSQAIHDGDLVMTCSKSRQCRAV